jgi:uncharacterized protein (DUF2235 family)
MSDGTRIALFLDGTWNTLNDNTNVWRMKSLCRVGADQLCYYSAGVGTQRGERLRGGMFGYGLDDEVIDAYEWLMEHYDPGDRVFIFGFSRGAFTARSLSGFISKCGLLKPGSPLSLNQLYARYRKGALAHTIRDLKNHEIPGLELEDEWLKEYSMAIPIAFQGVYDTVGALGVPMGPFARVSQSKYAFLETDLRINDDFAYHALAIDEHREAFAPTLWMKTVQTGAATFAPRKLSDVEQRWFVGAHADVGGGYESGLLAQVPLKWLMQKAASHGLQFKDTVNIDGNEDRAVVHDSFGQMAGGFYRLCKLGRPFYRAIGAGPLTTDHAVTTTINETIDASVFERWRGSPAYRPANLVAWARERRVEIDSLRGSVRADDVTLVDDDPQTGSVLTATLTQAPEVLRS